MLYKSNFSGIQVLMTIILLLLPVTFINSQGITPLYIQKSRDAEALEAEGEYADARLIYTEALKLATDDNDLRHQALFNDRIGRCLSMENRDDQALSYFRLALAQAGNVPDSALISTVLNHVGTSHEYSGNYDSAFYYFHRALVIREALNDRAGLAESYRNMAQIIRLLGRYSEARHYCRLAFELTDGNTPFKTVANIYNETAYLYELDNMLDSAAIYYNKLISVSSENNYYQGISAGHNNLASVNELQGNYEEALRNKLIGLKIDKEYNDTFGMLTSFRSIANYYISMQKYERALEYLDSATNICKDIWQAECQGIEQSRYRAHRAMGNYRKALIHFEKSVSLKDSLFNETKRKNIAEILTRYETEKKEQEIEILNKTNEIRSQKIRLQRFLLLGILLLSIAGAIISMQVIKSKDARISNMVLEMKNYMLMLKGSRAVENNHPPSGIERIELLMAQFRFTRREAEIMDLIMEGLTNEEIAERLFVSTNTVKFHIKNIYLKLDVKNRVQALRKASAEENPAV